jgi:hypothetical protein
MGAQLIPKYWKNLTYGRKRPRLKYLLIEWESKHRRNSVGTLSEYGFRRLHPIYFDGAAAIRAPRIGPTLSELLKPLSPSL